MFGPETTNHNPPRHFSVARMAPNTPEGTDVRENIHRAVWYPIVAVVFATLVAGCGGGGGGQSAGASSTGPAPGSVPDAPTLNELSFIDGGLALVFDRPAVGGSLPVSSYTATCTGGDVKTTVNGTASPISVLGLKVGTEYSCSVTATNAFGESKPSRVLKARPLEARTLSVVPVLGGVSSGVKAEIFRPDTGERLASGTTNSSGVADIQYFSTFRGPMVVKVSGATDATYYDYRVDAARPFSGGQSLLAVVPQSVSDKTTAEYGVTPFTQAVAAVTGVQSDSSGISIPLSLTADQLSAAVTKAMVYFGLDPTKVDLSTLPARLGVADVGSGKRLDGTDQQLSYGTALIALAKTAPSDVSIAEFSQRISSELKTGVAGNASTLLKGFPDAYSTAAKNAVVAASQSKLANPPSPGAFPWDSAVWDTAIWY